jgi:hypothetical protein
MLGLRCAVRDDDDFRRVDLISKPWAMTLSIAFGDGLSLAIVARTTEPAGYHPPASPLAAAAALPPRLHTCGRFVDAPSASQGSDRASDARRSAFPRLGHLIDD